MMKDELERVTGGATLRFQASTLITFDLQYDASVPVRVSIAKTCTQSVRANCSRRPEMTGVGSV
jgi:hypothetical protein